MTSVDRGEKAQIPAANCTTRNLVGTNLLMINDGDQCATMSGPINLLYSRDQWHMMDPLSHLLLSRLTELMVKRVAMDVAERRQMSAEGAETLLDA